MEISGEVYYTDSFTGTVFYTDIVFGIMTVKLGDCLRVNLAYEKGAIYNCGLCQVLAIFNDNKKRGGYQLEVRWLNRIYELDQKTLKMYVLLICVGCYHSIWFYKTDFIPDLSDDCLTAHRLITV